MNEINRVNIQQGSIAGISIKSVASALTILNDVTERIEKMAYYNTVAEWDSQPQLLSEKGAIYIYSDYATVDNQDIPNIKIGDIKLPNILDDSEFDSSFDDEFAFSSGADKFMRLDELKTLFLNICTSYHR